MKVKDLIRILQDYDPEAMVRAPDQWYGEEGSYSEVIGVWQCDMTKSLGCVVLDMEV